MALSGAIKSKQAYLGQSSKRLAALSFVCATVWMGQPGTLRAEENNRLPCASYGGLAFLGIDNPGTKAFFLTVIAPPPNGFGENLELRQTVTGTVVDAFSIPKPPGLHLSASPIVASGEAGRHTLYELSQGSECAIASATQDGGIVLPPTGGGGSGGGGGGGGGTGGGDGGSGGSEQALLGTTASPAFLTPYQISDRLVDWGFADGATRKSKARVWTQVDGLSFDDDRGSREGGGWWNMLTLGADVLATDTLRGGLVVGFEQANSDAHGGAVTAGFDGTAFGPYLAYRPDENLVLDLWVGAAERDVTATITDLSSSYDVSRLFVSANATRRWAPGSNEILGKLSVFWAQDDREDHAYAGPSGEFSVAGGTENMALVRLSGEVRHRMQPWKSGALMTPSIRLGVAGWIDRPEDGQIYDGSLVLTDTDGLAIDIGVGTVIEFPTGARLDAELGAAETEDGMSILGGRLAYRISF